MFLYIFCIFEIYILYLIFSLKNCASSIFFFSLRRFYESEFSQRLGRVANSPFSEISRSMCRHVVRRGFRYFVRQWMSVGSSKTFMTNTVSGEKSSLHQIWQVTSCTKGYMDNHCKLSYFLILRRCFWWTFCVYVALVVRNMTSLFFILLLRQ